MSGKQTEIPAGFRFSRYINTDEVSWEKETRKRLTNKIEQLSLL